MGAVFACDSCFVRAKAPDNMYNDMALRDNSELSPVKKNIDANQLQLLPKFTRVAIILTRSSFFSSGQ